MSQTPTPPDSDQTPCPTCGEPVGPRDKFCSICGANLSRSSQWVAPVAAQVEGPGTANDEIAPLPGTPGGPAPSTRRRKKQKPRWYKRPIIVVPLILLVILGSVGGVLAWQTRSALKDVHSVSTPPPEISAASLGGQEDAQIDTGPAQQALNDRATREAQNELPASETADDVQSTSEVPFTPTNVSQGEIENSPNEVRETANEVETRTPTSDLIPAGSTVGADETEEVGSNATEASDDQPESTGTTTNEVRETTARAAESRTPTNDLIPAGSTVRADETQEVSSDATDVSGDEPESTSTTTANSVEEPTETAVNDEGTATQGLSQLAVESDPVQSGGLTVLLMGVDSREGEAIDIGVRPDSLAVLHLDEETGSCRMLAVPRDSRAELPGYGLSKINHALAVAGIPYEMLVLEEYLGITLDHYALIDFAGLESVVDNLGGITVENPERFVMGDQTFEAGSLQLSGEQALLYSRFRGDSQGDFGRISRQQQVLRALLDKASGVNVVSTLPSMFNVLSDHFRTDFGVGDLVDLANDYRTSCTAESIGTRTIPGDVSMEFDDLMQMELSFVVSDPEQVQTDVEWLLGDESPADEATPTNRTVPFTMHQRHHASRITLRRHKPSVSS